MVKLLRSYTENEHGGVKAKYVNSHKLAPEMNLKVNGIVNNVFTNISEEEDDTYPPTIAEIARAQRKDRKYKKHFRSILDLKRDKKNTVKVIDTVEVLLYKKNRLIILKRKMQSDIVRWCHHYLQYPGETRMEATLKAVMYCPGMTVTIQAYIKTCDR
ncbi:MAG: hypothetical protein GY874_13800 [Desulfobacteraceae bacterium]|nr:hypothetical protein [Desulfobacteraceae bacterium]